jgi:hypothetical protein
MLPSAQCGPPVRGCYARVQCRFIMGVMIWPRCAVIFARCIADRRQSSCTLQAAGTASPLPCPWVLPAAFASPTARLSGGRVPPFTRARQAKRGERPTLRPGTPVRATDLASCRGRPALRPGAPGGVRVDASSFDFDQSIYATPSVFSGADRVATSLGGLECSSQHYNV